jgi:hypothetical protein
MCPVSLRESLQSAQRRPKYLYINPTGANPTGTILSESRDRFYKTPFRPENFSDLFSAQNFGQIYNHKQQIEIYLSIMVN